MDKVALEHNLKVLYETHMGLILLEGLKQDIDQKELTEVLYDKGGILHTIQTLQSGKEGSIVLTPMRKHFVEFLKLSL